MILIIKKGIQESELFPILSRSMKMMFELP